MRLGAGASLASGSALVVGGTFDLGGQNQTLGDVTGSGSILLDGGILTLGAADNAVLGASISGAGGLVKQGRGDADPDRQRPAIRGVTDVAAGTLIVETSSLNGTLDGSWQRGVSTNPPLPPMPCAIIRQHSV